MAYDEIAKQATLKYRAKNIKRIAIDLTLPEYNRIKDHCDQNGESLSGFLRRLAKEEIEKSSRN